MISRLKKSSKMFSEMALARNYSSNSSRSKLCDYCLNDYLDYCEDHGTFIDRTYSEKYININLLVSYIEDSGLVDKLVLSVKRFENFIHSLNNKSFEELKVLAFSKSFISRSQKLISDIVNNTKDINDVFYSVIEEAKEYNKNASSAKYRPSISYGMFSYSSVNSYVRQLCSAINDAIKVCSIFVIRCIPYEKSAYEELIVHTCVTPISWYAFVIDSDVLKASEVVEVSGVAVSENSLTREFDSLASRVGLKSGVFSTNRRNTDYEYSVKICDSSENFMEFLYVVNLSIPKYLESNGEARVSLGIGIKTKYG